MNLAKVAAAVALIGLAGALPACGGLSNEELQALAVLPDGHLAVQAPEDDGQALGANGPGNASAPLTGPGIVRQANVTAAVLNLYLAQVVAHIQSIAQRRPSSRAGHRFVWGPFPIRGRYFARVTIGRDPTATCPGEAAAVDDGQPRFRFTVELSDATTGTFRGVVTGQVHGSDFDHSCGSLTFDKSVDQAFGGAAALHDPASVTIGWTRDDTAHALDVQLSYADHGGSDLVGGVDYQFERGPSNEHRQFAFVAPVNLVRGSALENLHAAVQWSGAHATAGRADYQLDGGDVVGVLKGTACWNGRERYRDDWTGLTGDPSVCGAFEALPPP